MNIKTLGGMICAAALMTAQSSMAQTLTWKEQNVHTADHIHTLAVYDLSALDILHSLGIEAQIVPDAKFPATLKTYNNNTAIKAGSLFEPDAAKLTATKPDLIIVGGRSSTKQNEMAKIAPTLNLSADTGRYWEDLTARTRLLAHAFGKTDLAERKLQNIAAKQAQLKAQVKGKTAMMIFAPTNQFIPQAANERFGFVYNLAGLKSVVPLTAPKKADTPPMPKKKPEEMTAEERATADKQRADIQAQNQARLQAAVAQHPDYIIILDRSAVPDGQYTAQETVKTHPILSQSQAKFIFVDANAWYLVGAGLDNTEWMLDELIKGTR